MVYGFLTAWETIFAAAVLILVSVFVFGCIAVEVIAKDADLVEHENVEVKSLVSQNFQGVLRSMLTLMQFVTLDGLTDIYFPLIVEKPWLVPYFSILLVVSIGVLNLVTAALVEKGMENAAANVDEARERLKRKVRGATRRCTSCLLLDVIRFRRLQKQVRRQRP